MAKSQYVFFNWKLDFDEKATEVSSNETPACDEVVTLVGIVLCIFLEKCLQNYELVYFFSKLVYIQFPPR